MSRLKTEQTEPNCLTAVGSSQTNERSGYHVMMMDKTYLEAS
jgi:hypothetical protein